MPGPAAEPGQLPGSATGGGSACGGRTPPDVYGRPREAPLPLPPSHLRSAAPALPNLPYLARESPTLRTANTSSAVRVKCSGRGGRQLGLAPGQVRFGTVRAGAVERRAVRLLNLSTDVARITVAQPPPPLRRVRGPDTMTAGRVSTAPLPPPQLLACRPQAGRVASPTGPASAQADLVPAPNPLSRRRVLFKPGPIPPGMSVVLTFELAAAAAGDYVGEVGGFASSDPAQVGTAAFARRGD